MRRFTAFILLLVFFTSQYEKHLGYVNCRVVNYFKTEGNKCDCEKLLEDDTDPGAADALPVVHTHHHPDESYFPPANDKLSSLETLPGTFLLAATVYLPDSPVAGIDRPPQQG